MCFEICHVVILIYKTLCFAQPHTVSERWKEHNVFVQTEIDKLKQSILSSISVLKLRKGSQIISSRCMWIAATKWMPLINIVTIRMLPFSLMLKT